MYKCLVSGTFDPPTMGHMDMINRASKLCDQLDVCVAKNYSKSSMFTVEQRMEMLRHDTAHLKNVRVIAFEGHLANFVIENGYNAMFRGLRSESDFGYEIQLEHIYRKFFDGKAETVYLMTDPQYSYISSSIVRENYLLGADISGWVSAEVYDLMKKYKKVEL